LIEVGDTVGADGHAVVVAGEGADVDLIDDQVGKGLGVAKESRSRPCGAISAGTSTMILLLVVLESGTS